MEWARGPKDPYAPKVRGVAPVCGCGHCVYKYYTECFRSTITEIETETGTAEAMTARTIVEVGLQGYRVYV